MSIDPISIGISLALSAASMAMQASRRIEGPRLEDTKFNAADYGGLLTRFWGRRWIVPKVIFGEDLKHVEVESKTKGGKYNQHKYYGTWAVMIAPHPIQGVAKVKMDGHLVLDLTGAGPVTPFDFGEVSLAAKRDHLLATNPITSGMGIAPKSTPYFRIYVGAPGQEPDERMLATVEALNGVGSCPDFRGRSWLIIEELPLEKFGNRVPQLEIEALTASSGHVPTEQRDLTFAPNAAFNLRFSGDYSRVVWMSTDGEVEMWDVAARQPMMTWIGGDISPTSPIGLFSDGRIGFVADDTAFKVLAPGGGVTTVYDDGYQQYGAAVVTDGKGIEHWGTYPFSFYTGFYYDGVSFAPGWQACLFFPDSYGNVWVVGRIAFATDTVHFIRLTTVDNSPEYLAEFSIVMPVTASPDANGEGAYAAASGDNIILRWEGSHYLIDPTDASIVDSVAAPAAGRIYSAKTVWTNAVPGSGRVWLGNSEYDLLTGELIRTVAGVSGAAGTYPSVYDPINHALWVGEDGITIYHLDRVASAAITLRTIVEDVCVKAKIDLATIDATALTQEIAGYSVAGGTGKDWLEPLLDLYDVDARPHGFKLQFVNRGGAPGAEISSEDFAAPEEGEAPFSYPLPGATDVPTWLALQFADPAIDQQRNSTLSGPRGSADGMQPKTIDMTSLVLPVDEAQQLSGRLHRRIAWDTGPVELSLPAREIVLEPADVRPLMLRGATVKARLVTIEMRADRRFATEWKRDDPSVNQLDGATGATADGNEPSVIVIPGICQGFVLDLPLLRDADNDVNPQVYVAAGPYSADLSFPGASVFEAVLGDYSESIAGITAANRATWGWTTEALPDADPWVWDRGNVVNVMLQVGELTGCTEAAIDADERRNLALIGDEIVQFTTATLEIDGSYTLSGFKRGRRGTEWACATHGARDAVLLLNTAAPVAEGLSEVGTALSFKAVTDGRSITGAWPIDLAPFTGATLKPYAPCHLKAALASGDWTLSWVRRTRVGGAWTGGADIPLSEASEAYELDIMDGDTVVRTVTGLTSPTFTYTAAMQTTDFGGAISTVTFRVYQISDAVGRGFAATATSEPPATSALWRLTFPSQANVYIREIEMRDVIGGTDQCAGGTATADAGGAGSAAQAFDDSSTYWGNSGGGASPNHWIEYAFASPVWIAQLSLWCTNTPSLSPANVTLSYWNGAAFVDVLTKTALSWASEETKTFVV